MASEIRVNRLSNRSGLSTITFANGGVQFSGITTFANGEFYVGTGSTILNPSGNELQFHTGGSNRFTINNSGANLGTGNITAVDGTFTGNVSIAKTLTYEDVKNVDSVGVVTARTGVKVTGGDLTVGTAITASSVTGNVTQDVGITTFSGSATWFKGTTANKDMYWSKSSGSLVFKDTSTALFGDGSDLQISHSGSHSFVKHDGTGMLKICANMIDFRNAADNATLAYAQEGNKFELFYNGSAKLATTNTGVSVTGDLVVSANIDLADSTGGSNNRIQLGTGDDLQVYHDGSNGYVYNSGSGNLTLVGNGNNRVQIRAKNGENSITCNSDGNVELYHDGTRKFHTKSEGVAVEGSVNLEGSQATLPSHGGMTRHTNAYVYFTGKSDGNGAILSNGDGTATFRALNPGSSAGYAIIETGNGDTRLTIASDGRIFTSGRTSYSGNTTCDDLVIGNGSGHRGIAISSGSSSEGGIHFGDGESGNSSYRGIIAYNHADDSMQFRTAAAERLRITGAGKIGIGVASPFNRFQCGSHTFSGGHGMYNDSRVGMSNHGNLTGLMLGSTYNDANHPEYGLVFVQGPSTSSYNVWSISPDGPAKGNSLNLHYLAQATNIHSPGNRKFEFTGGGYLLKPNHPCFRAGLSANTSFNNGAVVIFGDTSSDAGHFNRNGCYNASTGKFTAPVAGIYEFTVGAIIMNISSGTDMTDCFELYYQPSGGTGIRIAYSNRRGEYIADETGNAGYYTDWLVGCMVNMAANSTVWVENKKRAHTWHGNTDYCWFTGKLIA